MNQAIYEFHEYKAYLKAVIEQMPKGGRGFRATLAEAISCQRAFVSQVLQGDSHFNLEHGEKIARLLSLTKDEAHFFLLLIQEARAGTSELKHYFRELIDREVQSRLDFKNRLANEKETSLEVKSRYYSDWIFGAIRVGVTIPKLRTKKALLKRLSVDENRLEDSLLFLEKEGLIEKRGDEYFPGVKHMHLGNDHDLTVRHHTNWRLRALENISARRKEDLHFSSVVSLSREDAAKIRAQLMDAIVAAQKVVRDSPEEVLFTLCADFFET